MEEAGCVGAEHVILSNPALIYFFFNSWGWTNFKTAATGSLSWCCAFKQAKVGREMSVEGKPLCGPS